MRAPSALLLRREATTCPVAITVHASSHVTVSVIGFPTLSLPGAERSIPGGATSGGSNDSGENTGGVSGGGEGGGSTTVSTVKLRLAGVGSVFAA